MLISLILILRAVQHQVLFFGIHFVRESECLLFQVKEIELEGYTEPETAQKKDTKQTAAVDLSKRLKDFRSLNDASSLKGLGD
ncbi:hypothetical protein L195_g033998 [Trifolium pratense]|uniref:Uncharacterized protein n=1 Tax=Trifolium pratense TaxID=57577 RepID=A0A2K3LHK7_TRIPR|nr:hypothetical protein L195_g033998 [Trifolium pratense]